MSQSIFIANQAGEELTGLVKAFEHYGYSVVSASEGEEASKVLKAGKAPIAILLNSTLKLKSTLDLCKEIKQVKKLLDTPIFIMTEEGFDKSQFSSLAISDFLTKPISTASMAQKIRTICGAGGNITSTKSQTGIMKIVLGILLVLFLIYLSSQILYPMLSGAK